MKSCIFVLILLDFVRLVYSLSSNISIGDDPEYVCPVNFFRRKRANAEYTRWRASIETTPQFIVKVLDEEITTPATNQIVAVNILPVTKRGEKIIVGGAMVPPPTTATSPPEEGPLPRDYTRFVPPTTVATRIEGDLYLAPAITPPSGTVNDDVPLKPMMGPARDVRLPPVPQVQFAPQQHSLRDESPPAGPQFLPRSREPLALARQYAPITRVAFSRPISIAPVTPPPPTRDDDYFRSSPTRSPYASLTGPSRTEDEFVMFSTYPEEDGFEISATRTASETTPERTTTKTTPTTQYIYDDFEIRHSTKKMIDELGNGDLEVNEKDVEATYNNLLFDGEDYPGGNANKTDDVLDDIHKEMPKVDEIDKHAGSDSLRRADNSIEETKTDNSSAAVESFADYEDYAKDNASIVYLGSAVRTETPTGKPNPEKRKCSLIKLRTLNFNSPRTLPEITAQLKQWAEDSPVARWVDITEGNLTAMENPIYMMIVDDLSNGQIVNAKHTVMIVAGIQGRDHHAVFAAMHILYQLIERSEAHSDLLSKYRFWIIPVFNPDGYEYSMTFPHRREWSKNLRQSWDECKGRDSCKSCETYGLRCTIQPCYGVNLDRNFEYQWIPTEKLRSEHPCGSLYAGQRQLSEAETRALTLYLHDQRPPLYAFIAFKEGDVLGVMYPYSHTKKRRIYDSLHRQRASRAAAAAYSISGRPYVAGQTSEFLPLYAGGIEDWVDGHLGVDNTYTIMMFRPSDAYGSRLMTERAVHEAYAAMDTLLLQCLIEPPSADSRHVLARRSNSRAVQTLPCYFTILLGALNCFIS